MTLECIHCDLANTEIWHTRHALFSAQYVYRCQLYCILSGPACDMETIGFRTIKLSSVRFRWFLTFPCETRSDDATHRRGNFISTNLAAQL